MNELDYKIELHDLRKVYQRNISDQMATILKSALGITLVNEKGGIALNDLTLTFNSGERIGIIGRNGAGKSTLLQILAGVIEPSSGVMKIDGHVTAVLTLGIGLQEELTGRENIYLDGEMQGKSRSQMQDEIEEIIEFAELGEFIDLPLRTYSTGMKSRLAFAMISQIDPEILIIDEALSVGDTAFAIKAGKKIKELCDSGAIVLIVSHGMQSIRDLCNRCIWLDNGDLIMDGTPEEVTKAYLESVREADNEKNLVRFRSMIGAKSIASGFNLSTLELCAGGQCVSRLTSGDELSICFNYDFTQAAEVGKFVLEIHRLDGALVYVQELEMNTSSDERVIKVKITHLNLAPGYYSFCVVWRTDAGEIRAETRSILEMIAHEEPVGGRPVLMNLGRVESEMKNSYQELL